MIMCYALAVTLCLGVLTPDSMTQLWRLLPHYHEVTMQKLQVPFPSCTTWRERAIASVADTSPCLVSLSLAYEFFLIIL